MKTLLTSAILASAVITGTTQADNSLSSLIYKETANIYTDVSYEKSSAASIRSYGDDHNQNSVWSYEYEPQYFGNQLNNFILAEQSIITITPQKNFF